MGKGYFVNTLIIVLYFLKIWVALKRAGVEVELLE